MTDRKELAGRFSKDPVCLKTVETEQKEGKLLLQPLIIGKFFCPPFFCQMTYLKSAFLGQALFK